MQNDRSTRSLLRRADDRPLAFVAIETSGDGANRTRVEPARRVSVRRAARSVLSRRAATIVHILPLSSGYRVVCEVQSIVDGSETVASGTRCFREANNGATLRLRR